MFFKPRWYKMLPDSVKPINEDVIKRIKEFHKEIKEFQPGLSDEMIWMGIMTSRWAVKRIQKSILEQAKKQMPNASEQELWAGVLVSRFHAKLINPAETQPFAKPLSQEEILSRMENTANIVSGFKSFDDVLNYVIAMDEEENRFYDPTGMQEELNNLLEGGTFPLKGTHPDSAEAYYNLGGYLWRVRGLEECNSIIGGSHSPQS